MRAGSGPYHCPGSNPTNGWRSDPLPDLARSKGLPISLDARISSHLPMYSDGLRIRSIRSASALFTAACRRRRLRAAAKFEGSLQIHLTRRASSSANCVSRHQIDLFFAGVGLIEPRFERRTFPRSSRSTARYVVLAPSRYGVKTPHPAAQACSLRRDKRRFAVRRVGNRSPPGCRGCFACCSEPVAAGWFTVSRRLDSDPQVGVHLFFQFAHRVAPRNRRPPPHETLGRGTRPWSTLNARITRSSPVDHPWLTRAPTGDLRVIYG